MKYISIIFYLFLLVFNCTIDNPPVTTSSIAIELEEPPSRWQLRRNFYNKGEILVVYNAKDTAVLTQYNLLFSNITKETLGRRNSDIQIKHKVSSEVTDEEIKNSVLFIVGTDESNPLLSSCLLYTSDAADE